MCLHQLTNSSFPCNSYFICKSIWNFYPILYWRPNIKISCSETSWPDCKFLWDSSLQGTTNLLSIYLSAKNFGAKISLLLIYIVANNKLKVSNTILLYTVCVCYKSQHIPTQWKYLWFITHTHTHTHTHKHKNIVQRA